MQIRRRPPTLATVERSYQPQADVKPRNVLEEIVWYKEQEVAQMRDSLPLVDLQQQITDAPWAQDFLLALQQSSTRPSLIAEVKKLHLVKG